MELIGIHTTEQNRTSLIFGVTEFETECFVMDSTVFHHTVQKSFFLGMVISVVPSFIRVAKANSAICVQSGV